LKYNKILSILWCARRICTHGCDANVLF